MIIHLVGRLDPCFLLSFAISSDRVRPLVPRSLNLISYGSLSFANVVISRIRDMRPKGFPRVAGMTYWHAALRIHVMANSKAGSIVEGLYFVRSLVSCRVVSSLGNLISDFNMTPSSFDAKITPGSFVLQITPHVHLSIVDASTGRLPETLPFKSPEERERYLKYSPIGIAPANGSNRIRVSEVLRDVTMWRETPVQIEAASWRHADLEFLESAQLVRATRVGPIDYEWKLGRIESVELNDRRHR